MIEAELDRVIAHNPARRIKLPPKPKRLVDPFTDEQVDSMLDAAGDRWRGLIALGIGPVLRSAELRAVSSSPDSLDGPDSTCMCIGNGIRCRS